MAMYPSQYDTVQSLLYSCSLTLPLMYPTHFLLTFFLLPLPQAGSSKLYSEGNSTGTLFDVHLMLSNHNVPCITFQLVPNNFTVLGGQKVIGLDQNSPEAEIAFVLSQKPFTVATAT